MEMNTVKGTLKKMDSQRRVLFIASFVGALLAFVMLILYIVLPAVRVIVSDTSSSFYHGFNYPGWQMMFYGYGMQYINNRYDFGTNPTLIAAFFIAFFALIVCSVLYSFGKNKQKGICEIVCAVCLIVCGIILGCVRGLGLSRAGELFYNETLATAIAEGGYTVQATPVICSVVLCIAGVIKGLNGAFLFRQREYVKNNLPLKDELAQEA